MRVSPRWLSAWSAPRCRIARPCLVHARDWRAVVLSGRCGARLLHLLLHAWPFFVPPLEELLPLNGKHADLRRSSGSAGGAHVPLRASDGNAICAALPGLSRCERRRATRREPAVRRAESATEETPIAI